MPIYEYRCESCGDKFEKLVRRATDVATEVMEAGCPSCGEKHLEQQYSTFAARGGASADGSFTPAETRGCEGGMCGSGMCSRN
jgi:putative FmdB family regulatory protein